MHVNKCFICSNLIVCLLLQAEADLVEHSEGGSRPVAIATGFLRPYQSMVQVRQQVVALLMSDWSVLCFDHQLKFLWKSAPLKVHNEDDMIV